MVPFGLPSTPQVGRGATEDVLDTALAEEDDAAFDTLEAAAELATSDELLLSALVDEGTDTICDELLEDPLPQSP